jgi:phage host-nuclease inhibitor protein Gam
MAMNLPTLNEFLDEQEGVKSERFTVTNEQEANWVLRKIKSLEAKKADNIALAEAEIAKIDAWLEQVNGEIDRSLEYFKGLLTAYAVEQRAKDPKFKSLKLPNGKIGFRKQQPKWNYDNDKVIKALKEIGREDLIRVKEEPDKVNIKKVMEVKDGKVIDPETGVIIEGVTVEDREDELKIEVSE